jgi:hypothetical protein
MMPGSATSCKDRKKQRVSKGNRMLTENAKLILFKSEKAVAIIQQ